MHLCTRVHARQLAGGSVPGAEVVQGHLRPVLIPDQVLRPELLLPAPRLAGGLRGGAFGSPWPGAGKTQPPLAEVPWEKKKHFSCSDRFPLKPTDNNNKNYALTKWRASRRWR